MRILHVSDLHLAPDWSRVPFKAWLNKRLAGGANLLLGRGKHYDGAHDKIPLLERFRNEQQVDFVVCTGDFTALGTELELSEARAEVSSLLDAPRGCAAVPGNHDLYAPDTWRTRRFEHHYGEWLATDLPEYRVEEGPYPYVRLLDDGVAIVGVNSAAPRPFWTSSGRIPQAQLDALGHVLADARLSDLFIFVITHYASRIENGRRDKRSHRLVNADAFLRVVANVPRGALLCGHVHRRFLTRIEGVKPSLFCAGSATKADREGLWLFEVDASGGRAIPGRLGASGYELDVPGAVTL